MNSIYGQPQAPQQQLPPWDPNYSLYMAQQQQQQAAQQQQAQQQQLPTTMPYQDSGMGIGSGIGLSSLFGSGGGGSAAPAASAGAGKAASMQLPPWSWDPSGAGGAASEAAKPGMYSTIVSGLTPAPGTSVFSSTALAPGLVGAGILAGGAVGYNQFTGARDALKGKKLTFGEQAALAPLTGGLSFFSNSFGSGKGKDQRRRDSWRKDLREKGFLDDNYAFTDTEGNTFQYGAEGLRQDYKGDIIKGRTPDNKSYNINWDNVNANNDQQQILGAIDPLMFILTGGEKRWQDAVGNAFNDAMNSGDPGKRVAAMYQKANELGLTWGEQKEMIRQANEAGKIDDSTRDAWYAATDRVYGVQNPNNPQPQQGGITGGGAK